MSSVTRSATLYSVDSGVDGTSQLTSATTLVDEQLPKKTGRPNKWSAQRLRRLSRLYSYTTLPPEHIPKALEEKDWAPKQDSATKYVNTLLGSQPRWIRPKDREQMDTRIDGLSSCKAARKKNVDCVQNDGSTTNDSQALDTGDYEWTESPLSGLMAMAPEIPYTSNFCSSTSTYSTPIHPPVVALPEQDPFDMEWNAQQISGHEPQIRHSRSLRLFPSTSSAKNPPSVSRETFSTYVSTSSIKRRLPQYSIPYLKRVVRLLEAHSVSELTTEYTTIHQAYSVSAKTIGMKSESNGNVYALPRRISGGPLETATMFPDTFLILDRCIRLQGICIPGLKPHDSKSCWCAVLEDLGPSEANFWKLKQQDLDVNVRDKFGNSILHLLAARGASWNLLMEIIDLGADANAKNIAGQNFLHVIDHTVLRTMIQNEAGDLFLQKRDDFFLQKLDDLKFGYSDYDLFGRTFFHTLSHCADTLSGADQPWAWLQHHARKQRHPFARDAFGWIPHKSQRTQIQSGDFFKVKHLITASDGSSRLPVIHEGNGPPIPKSTKHSASPAFPHQRIEFERRMSRMNRSNWICTEPNSISAPNDDILWKHARLIETARLAFEAPWIEDVDGRNGLQCLAAADLSLYIENGQVTSSTSVKRKRGRDEMKGVALKLLHRCELVEKLISRGVNLNSYDNKGTTVLMSFVIHLCDGEDDKILTRIFEILIRRGANLHWRNRYGETALHIAVRMGRKVATRVLLESGANVHARMGEGVGVLALGEMSYFEAREKPHLYASIMACMALCIQYGAVAAPTLLQEWSLRVAHTA